MLATLRVKRVNDTVVNSITFSMLEWDLRRVRVRIRLNGRISVDLLFKSHFCVISAMLLRRILLCQKRHKEFKKVTDVSFSTKRLSQKTFQLTVFN